MLHVLGIEETIKNVYMLSKKFMKRKHISNTYELKPFYLKFLKKHQPVQPIPDTLSISFIADTIGIWTQLNPESSGNALDDIHQQSMIGEAYSTDEQAQHLEALKLGYLHLTESNTELKALFDLIIHTIFLRKSRTIDQHISFGGSSSAGIGLIWISGHGALDRADIAELLLHELTHHQLFIDERCHMHYNYAALCKPENFSSSAILNKKRPLDKVVHSIIVATEIILARNKFLTQQETKVHATSKDLMAKAVAAIKETMRMANINELLSERTRKMLEKAEASLSAIEGKLMS
ncbi:MAG: HEXXH motif-containing putative peptide modification protein [Candidatus Cardinium sp.]|uniref:aKG-HExxH-type peptide beta-hydroxylase n=1 Tax=Cardinium endosymbiont of Dermatophagoides farinae TaxID=2597823 RepID=UPI0011838912|nr:HEXXH motif-containing putative peptide modification protein [Cardinium endosymbiont of Dermatophagoides farinae]TSJ81272.1 hypothetical protein FPG78_04760 [Cardinium endosymbiont of Dermatophagoides farinae]UWW97330.1 MAG: HEXXH motif-containing putative peptide modification protein [Candidatus Cardinium sp.]